MPESRTITGKHPPFKSMDYAFLRGKGLKHIQNLSGKVYSDCNSHDPGITILEAAAYALASECYKLMFPIEDILATDPSKPYDIRNFYSARDLLQNSPVTVNDYRKLIIDVQKDQSEPDCSVIGVKNAWLRPSKSEVDIYIDCDHEELTYNQSPAGKPLPLLEIKCLHQILVEFGACKLLDDLNETFISASFVVDWNITEQTLRELQIDFTIQFPHWADLRYADFSNTELLDLVETITFAFTGLPSNHSLQGEFDPATKKMVLTGTKPGAALQLTDLVQRLNAFLILDTNAEQGPLALYRNRCIARQKLIDETKKRLNKNRALCEDYTGVGGYKVERIAICANFKVGASVDINDLAAEIIYRLQLFVSETITFRSLAQLQGQGHLSEEIFDGPALENGFIREDDLDQAEIMTTIHVSDLINVIMDVPGIIAVDSMLIGNIPMNNNENISQKNVRWCLDLAFEHGYVPRLSLDDSKLIFYKESLPFRPDDSMVRLKLDAKKFAEPFPRYTKNDIPIPQGRYRNIGSYRSLQDELPLLYGVGPASYPENSTTSDKVKIRQLKAYLSFFDQLIANFINQLENTRNIFSYDDKIDRTYFENSIETAVADLTTVDVNPQIKAILPDLPAYRSTLKLALEPQSLYEDRRNRILDHLLARFAETFSDHPLLAFTIDGVRSAKELIKDKISFLKNYPTLSKRRGQGFNYKDCCRIWHVDNLSGLEQRAAYLSGIDHRSLSYLSFGSSFTGAGNSISVVANGFTISDNTGTLLREQGAIITLDESNEIFERVVIAGIFRENYLIVANGDGTFHFALKCHDSVIAVSDIAVKRFISNAPGGDADTEIVKLQGILRNELLENTRANRKNLAIDWLQYFDTTQVIIDQTTPCVHFKFSFDLKIESEVILQGDFSGNLFEKDAYKPAELEDAGKSAVFWQVIMAAREKKNYRLNEATYVADGAYWIEILDRCNVVLARSRKVDFNDQLAASMQNQSLEIYLCSPNNDGAYAVTSATASGPFIEITLNRALDVTQTGGFVKIAGLANFESSIVGMISPDIVVIRGGEGKKEIARIIRLINEHFFSHEGFHLVEHVLLRPRVANPFAQMATSLSTASGGTLRYPVFAKISGVDATSSEIEVDGDLTPLLRTRSKISIVESAGYNGTYTVISFAKKASAAGVKTLITVREKLPPVGVYSHHGKIRWMTRSPVKKISASRVTLNDPNASALPFDTVVKIENSTKNNGVYQVRRAYAALGSSIVELGKRKKAVHDKFLPISLQADCSCQTEDPYSFLITVIIPYWPGRFMYSGFREFMEKTIREEVPSHVLVNICWVGNDQLLEFEKRYKAWLIELSAKEINPITYSKALNEFIATFTQLQTVNSPGVLHDCESGNVSAHSIVLDKSSIGTINF